MNYKAMLKALVPLVATIVAVAVQYALTGEFDREVVATAVTGTCASLIAFLVPNDVDGDKLLDRTPIQASVTRKAEKA